MDPDFWGTLHTVGGLRRLRLVHTTYSSRTVTGSGHAENQEIGYDQTPSSKRNTGRGCHWGVAQTGKTYEQAKKIVIAWQ